jgi:4-hydroxy-3-methylbut-2-en-1-yl diphosphate reductase
MNIVIDREAGFCPGVKKALDIAERNLREEGVLVSLGDLLHNEGEMERLSEKGLSVAGHADIPFMGDKKLLIRAHGEPPETFRVAAEAGVRLVDATCGIVKRLQQKVQRAAEEMERLGGQVVIFGRKDHPEVIGLAGHAMGRAIVVGSLEEAKLAGFTGPVRLFSQTTMNGDAYDKVASLIRNNMQKLNPAPDFISYDSICRHVSRRVPALQEFARMHDVVVFTGGKKSANGKKLFHACRQANPHSHFVSTPAEIDPEWFTGAASVGISGAASTPPWLLEEIANKIREIS